MKNNMKNSEIFFGEVQLLKNKRLANAVTRILDEIVPDYFYIVSASSTGKYHPWYSLGYGGLVRHTKAAVKIAYDLLQLEQNKDLPADYILAALILHDTFKHGKIMDKYTVEEHPIVAAAEIQQWANENLEDEMKQAFVTFGGICDLISSHMGQWNSGFMPTPETAAQKFVHMCDYLASRKYIIVEVN